ncbi:hypothetical protein [Telluribacter sp.]|jgi:hypothetical protein|uniref:hypothetical protein n=1 Tax=Telluribacter sp. TaxID=1978767 RepID=UPI002E0FC29D|nr:hypothetical protein [Telluribacter sp.]
MKKKFLLYTTGVVALLYSCSTKDLPSVDPFAPSLRELEKMELPDITLQKPAPVTIVPGSVKESAKGAAAVRELTSLGTEGTLSVSSRQFATAVMQAVPESQATAVRESTSAGTLGQIMEQTTYTEAQRVFVKSLKGLPTEAAGFLPQLSQPLINGKPAGARSGLPEGTTPPTPVATGPLGTQAPDELMKGEDGCKSAALEALTRVLEKLQQKKAEQLARADAEFQKDLKEAGANKSCEADKNRKEAVKELEKKYKKLFDDLGKSKKKDDYKARAALLNALFYAELDAINSLYLQELAACAQAQTLREAAARAALEANKQQIEANYKQEADKATGIANALIAACHNQGGGK